MFRKIFQEISDELARDEICRQIDSHFDRKPPSSFSFEDFIINYILIIKKAEKRQKITRIIKKIKSFLFFKNS